MKEYLEQIRLQLHEKSDPIRQQNTLRFFKEPIKTYGINSAEVSKIAKHTLKLIKNQPKEAIFSLCEDLWRSGYLEEGGIACEITYAQRKQYTVTDFFIFERWLEQYVSNWASCDTLCNHSIGDFIEQFPEYIQTLKEWTKSNNRWKRRAAAVTLIIPARQGHFLKDIFEIADLLLTDADDLVQKGYGWMLKAASEAHLNDVFSYLMAHKKIMPRTAFRYALEKMPKEMKAQAMKK